VAKPGVHQIALSLVTSFVASIFHLAFERPVVRSRDALSGLVVRHDMRSADGTELADPCISRMSVCFEIRSQQSQGLIAESASTSHNDRLLLGVWLRTIKTNPSRYAGTLF